MGSTPQGDLSDKRTSALEPVWLLDLDGVVWLADDPISGSAQAVEELRSRGIRLVFVTNNSSLTLDEYVAKLDHHGIPADRGDMMTSALAAASLVEEGNVVLACGGPGVTEALEGRGAKVLLPEDESIRNGAFPLSIDCVVVGWDRKFDFDRLAVTASAARKCGRLIGTNDDATYPTGHGLLPGSGSILAAVAKASGVEPVVAGKPYQVMADMVSQRWGRVEYMVGDRPSTDGLMAKRIGCHFALVDSGVTPAGTEVIDPPPYRRAADLSALVKIVAGDE
ncbi:MAG: HAD-IIA family hydrolase [Acidimicrobiales bacterium]